MSDAPVYIAPDGNDEDPGSEAQPVLTLDRASALVKPGGTIYYTAGVHHHLTQQTISKNGTAEERITVCPVPGAHVEIDGSGSEHTTLVMVDGNYVTFRDIEVQNSSRQGIGIYAATGAHVINCVVHDCWETGIISEGPSAGKNVDTLIEGCTVFRNTNHNLDGTPGYGQGISLSVGTGGTVRNCYVFNNMGEGIGIQKGHVGATVTENVAYDNYKINIYVDSPVDGAMVTQNLIFCTGNNCLTYGEQERSTGITFARETGEGHLDGIVCEGNGILGCHRGISFFEQRKDSGLTNSSFARNMIMNSVEAAWHIEASGASGNKITDSAFISMHGSPLFAGNMSGYELSDNFCHPEEAA